MRMDVLPEDSGRREQTLDAGAETILALHRLARVAQTQAADSPAYARQIDQTHQAITDYCGRAGRFFTVLFTPQATFVGGELLRGPRSTQDAALELASYFQGRSISELAVTRDVTPQDLYELSLLLVPGVQTGEFSNPRIRVRAASEAARHRGLVVEHLPIDRRIARTYGEAIVSMRQLYDELLAGLHVLPPRIKRIAQSLVELSSGQNPFFVGVTETYHASPDEAVRAVHAAILAAAMARELGADRLHSVEIVMAALLHDVAIARIRARAAEQTGRSNDDPESDAELPAGTAATLGTFSGLSEASMPRAVIAFESQWARFPGPLGPVYQGARAPTLHARIVSTAHAWAKLRVPDSSLYEERKSLDQTMTELLDHVHDASDLVMTRLLVSTLRFYPLGSIVDLNTGEVAEVVRSVEVGHGAPTVRVTVDSDGTEIDEPFDVDLADPSSASRRIVRIRNIERWRRAERPLTRSPARSSVAPNSVPAPLSDTRGSLPSISPGLLDGLNNESEDFIQSLRSELSDQLADVLPMSSARPPMPTIDDSVESLVVREPSSPPSFARTLPTPSARGTLAATPLVHVLVYVLEHAVTGSVELIDPDAVSHIVYVRKGAPVKVRTGRLLAPLGEVLAHSGKVASESIAGLVTDARNDGVLVGEHMISQGLITRGQLWSALEIQIPLKLEWLANLPPKTEYVLYKDVNLLERWGGADAVAADPVHVIHSVARRWHDQARIRTALARISKHPLIVRADAKIGGLKLSQEERSVLDAMREQRTTLGVLHHMHLADPDAVNSLVYALALTRQLQLPNQPKAPPMGLRAASLPVPSSRGFSSHAPVAVSAPPPTSSEGVPRQAGRRPGDRDDSRPAPASYEVPAPALSGSIASPMSSATGVPPVSSSRERMTESARRGFNLTQSGQMATSASAAPPNVSRPITPSDALDAADRALEGMGAFRRAELAAAKGDFVSAEVLAEEAIALDPEPVDYRALLAWVHAQSSGPEQLPDMIATLSELLVGHPDHPRVLLYRARLYKRQGALGEAIADYEAHLRVSPKSREGLAELNALRGG